MAKTRLSGVQLDEVSLVDSPAAHLSKVVLMKRDDVEKAAKGVQFNLGFKDDGSSAVQSVVFDKEVWDEDAAKEWLEEHKMHSGKMDTTENTMRFRQSDPKEYSKFRMITPGKQISKALRASESLSRVQEAISTALRAKFSKPPVDSGMYAPSPWLRDLYEDDVVYDIDGKTFRVSYEVTMNGGNFEVEFGEPAQVEVAYVDIGKAKKPASLKSAEPEDPEEADEDLVARLSRTEEKLKGIKEKLEKFNPYHDAKGRFTQAKGAARISAAGREIGIHTNTANKMTSTAKKLSAAALVSRKPQDLRNAAESNLKAAKTWRDLAAKHPKNSTQQLTAQNKAKLHSSVAAKLTRQSRSANP